MDSKPVGRRGRFAVIVPSTNTVVEHDYAALNVPGVTFHTGRMYIDSPQLGSDSDFLALLTQIRQSMEIAIRDVLTAEPTHMLMGMSAETFWGGKAGNADFVRRIEARSGLRVSTGASSMAKALQKLGAKRISFITPYQRVADDEVRRFFVESGFEVVNYLGLRCATATSISHVSASETKEALLAVDDPTVDAIVQVGTNLSAIQVANDVEALLGKPVLAINSTVAWDGLRAAGIDDKVDDFGVMFREF